MVVVEKDEEGQKAVALGVEGEAAVSLGLELPAVRLSGELESAAAQPRSSMAAQGAVAAT